jgi:hypothetical protein
MHKPTAGPCASAPHLHHAHYLHTCSPGCCPVGTHVAPHCAPPALLLGPCLLMPGPAAFCIIHTPRYHPPTHPTNQHAQMRIPSLHHIRLLLPGPLRTPIMAACLLLEHPWTVPRICFPDGAGWLAAAASATCFHCPDPPASTTAIPC